jgi:hypothetical protein
MRKAGPFDDLAVLTSHLEREAKGYDDDIKRAIGDCGQFVNRALEETDVARDEEYIRELSDALGTWVLLNLYERCPSLEESQPARAIGRLAVFSFDSWWDEAIG